MGWTRSPGRIVRDRRRPCLENLETRQLLSQVSGDALPAASPAPVKNSDGSTNYDQIIGASAARAAFGVDGTGSNVAVIDTGVNYKNATLGGSMGPGSKVVAGVDFTGSPNGVLPAWQHGTGVAGILAANSPNYQGVAPGAGIVALRVFGDDNQGSFGNIERALDWVVQNHAAYNITAVNLSISDGGNYLTNAFGQDGGIGQAITGTVRQLDAMNIPVVVAAGNSFNGKAQGVGFPASIPDTIGVTATDASDKLVSNAQRQGTAAGGSGTIAAPGAGLSAPGVGNSMETDDGTSFATPQVTGGIVLLQQIYDKAFHQLPTVNQIENFLQQGAHTVHDNATNTNIGRLDILNSARLLTEQIASLLGAGHAPSTPADPAPVVPVVVSPPAAPVVKTPVVAPQILVPEQPATTPDPAPPVKAAPPTAPPPQSAPTPAPVPAPPAAPLTEVYYNGVSVGNYSTTQLSARYGNLFTFLKGPVGSIRIYGPRGSVPDLGASKPSGSVSHAAKPAVKHPKPAPHVTATPGTPRAVAHKTAAPKKHTSFLESLFPFKF